MARLSWPGWLVTYRDKRLHLELNPDAVTHTSTEAKYQCETNVTSLAKTLTEQHVATQRLQSVLAVIHVHVRLVH